MNQVEPSSEIKGLKEVLIGKFYGRWYGPSEFDIGSPEVQSGVLKGSFPAHTIVTWVSFLVELLEMVVALLLPFV